MLARRWLRMVRLTWCNTRLPMSAMTTAVPKFRAVKIPSTSITGQISPAAIPTIVSAWLGGGGVGRSCPGWSTGPDIAVFGSSKRGCSQCCSPGVSSVGGKLVITPA